MFKLYNYSFFILAPKKILAVLSTNLYFRELDITTYLKLFLKKEIVLWTC